MKSPPHFAPAAAGATTNYKFEQRWRLRKRRQQPQLNGFQSKRWTRLRRKRWLLLNGFQFDWLLRLGRRWQVLLNGFQFEGMTEAWKKGLATGTAQFVEWLRFSQWWRLLLNRFQLINDRGWVHRWRRQRLQWFQFFDLRTKTLEEQLHIWS